MIFWHSRVEDSSNSSVHTEMNSFINYCEKSEEIIPLEKRRVCDSLENTKKFESTENFQFIETVVKERMTRPRLTTNIRAHWCNSSPLYDNIDNGNTNCGIPPHVHQEVSQ